MDCKYIVNTDKCVKCGERGYSCCKNFTPTFEAEELARLHHETDAIEKKHLGVYQVGRNQFIVARPEQVTGRGIRIDAEDCPFYKDYKCSIYDYRPKICREYGCTIDCGMGDLTKDDLEKASDTELMGRVIGAKGNFDFKAAAKIMPSFSSVVIKMPKFNKKLLKTMKEDMLFYLVGNIIRQANDEELKKRGIHRYFKYHLVSFATGRIAGSKMDRFKADPDSRYKVLVDVFNITTRHLFLMPQEYQDIIRNKLNGILAGLNFKDIEVMPEGYESTFDGNAIIMSHLLYQYYINYKKKSKRYAGIVKHADLYKIIRDFNVASGGNAFVGDERAQLLSKYGEQLYKQILLNN